MNRYIILIITKEIQNTNNTNNAHIHYFINHRLFYWMFNAFNICNISYIQH
jgi:hypothetical protein